MYNDLAVRATLVREVPSDKHMILQWTGFYKVQVVSKKILKYYLACAFVNNTQTTHLKISKHKMKSRKLHACI